MSGVVIRAEGIEWPLEAYLDAHGFQRFEYDRSGHWLPPFSEAPHLGTAIMPDGTMVEAEGRELPWTELIAFRARDGASARCGACGEFFADADLYLSGMDYPICDGCLDWSGLDG